MIYCNEIKYVNNEIKTLTSETVNEESCGDYKQQNTGNCKNYITDIRFIELFV